MRNDGILPAFACLKIVILETVNMLASSSAVKARPIRSIRSGSDIGSAVLLHIPPKWIYFPAIAAYCFGTVVRAPVHVPGFSFTGRDRPCPDQHRILLLA